MLKNEKKKAVKKKVSPALKFFSIVFTVVVLFVFVSGIAVLGYIISRPSNQLVIKPNQGNNSGKKNEDGFGIPFIDPVKSKTNFVLYGVDADDSRTDTIMAGCFDRDKMTLNLLSIPRDTRVTMPEDRRRILKEEGHWTPDVMKINEVHVWARDHAIEFCQLQLEELLGVKFDYYAEISTKAFREIIDTIGGVEMTLERSYKYYDPTQNLRINLSPGKQVLMGADAEGFVRYRHDYRDGDMQRIKVQQLFMSELLKQVLDKDTFVEEAHNYVRTVLNNVKTNLNLDEALPYLKYITEFKAENFNTFVLPGEGKYIGDISYFIVDESELSDVVQEVFYGVSKDVIPIYSKDLSIEVLNGVGKTGLASYIKDKMVEAGYEKVTIDDFEGTKKDKTRIYVKKNGYGKDLLAMFPTAEIIVDKTKITGKTDIVIVIGKNDSDMKEATTQQ